MSEETRGKLMLRLPGDVRAFVEEQSVRYGSSRNSEIIRSIREKMERIAATSQEEGTAR